MNAIKSLIARLRASLKPRQGIIDSDRRRLKGRRGAAERLCGRLQGFMPWVG
jgi:hypothetical protein